MATLKDRLTVPAYKQWMKGGLVLKHLQAGIADYLDDEVRYLHGKILNDVKATLPAGVAMQCVACNNTLARKKKWTCSSHNICTIIRDELETQHERGPGKLTMVNTDVSKWTDTNKHWEIGKCYCSPGYSDKQTVKEIDCSGLLGLISNCTVMKQKFSRTLTQPDNVFEEVREIRNKKLMHSADLTLQVVDLDELVRKSLKILQTQSSVLKNDATNAAKIKNNDLRDALLRKASSMDDAERKIVEIHSPEFTMTLEDELKVLSNKVKSLGVNQVQLEERVKQQNQDQNQDQKTTLQKDIDKLKSNKESLEEKVKTDMDFEKEMRNIVILLDKINNCLTTNIEGKETIQLEIETIKKKNENLTAILVKRKRGLKSEIQEIEQFLQECE